jgi:hypothetical protein
MNDSRSPALHGAGERVEAVAAMTPPVSLRWARAYRGALLTLVYAAVAAFVLNSFQLKWGFRDGSDWMGFDKMLEGTAHRPLAYRVLVPRIAGALAPLVPQKALDALEKHNVGTAEDAKRSSVLVRFGWKREYLAAALVAYFIQFGSIVVTLVASRALVRELLGYGRAFQDFGPAVGMLLLPMTFHRGGYVYDFPELAFCAVGVLLLVRGRMLAWYACFALACLNKEADVLLAIQFAAFSWRRMPFRRLVAHAALHVLIGTAILLGLRAAFADNPGAPTFFHLPGNVAALGRPSTWFGFIDVYAPFIPFPRPFNLLTLAILFSTLAIGWREKSWEVRWAFVGTMAVLVPLFMVTGYRDEVRNFSLAFVPFCLLACDTVHRVYERLRQADAVAGAR